MSHFTVAVITDGTKTIDELLAPYQENSMEDCPKEYLKFVSVEEEYKKEYEEDGHEMIRLENGELVDCWDKMFSVKTGEGLFDNKIIIPEYLERVLVKHRDTYKTFEEFMRGWGGHESRDEQTGEYGYWENPNAQWDWYTIGGRWSNSLLVKDGSMSIKRSNSLDDDLNDVPEGYIWVDMAYIKDIKFDLMKDSNKSVYEKRWNEAQEHDAVYKKMIYGIENEESKEEYIDRNSGFETYAVITPDGKWHSKGKMGWWGCSSETQEESTQWNESFYNTFIKDANPDWLLTIVDCHI